MGRVRSGYAVSMTHTPSPGAGDARARTVPARQLLTGDVLVSAMGDTYDAPITRLGYDADGFIWVLVSRKWLRLTEYEDVTIRNPTLP